MNGQKVLLVPWLCGTSLQEHIDASHLSDKYDIMMGHFEIAASCEIPNKGRSYANAYKSGSKNYSSVEKDNIVSEILHHTNDFSTIYLGHIHDHEVLTFENRTWNIVGSPQYQVHDMQRLPDSKKLHGYYILDEKNNEEFNLSTSVPRFVTLYASDMVNGKLDESKLKGAIVRRCYDIVLTDEQKVQMDTIVTNANVYEEDSSVFVLGTTDEDGNPVDETEELGVMFDKFEYITGQIGKIHHEAIDNEQLTNLMREYYNRALV